jgi:putative DNA primase/helicase
LEADFMAETPKEAARRLAAQAIAEGYEPERLHEYRDAAGKLLYWRIRARRADGAKWIRPMKLNGHGYELGEPAFPNGKPLYNLDMVASQPDALVYVCEGEKAADALTRLGAVATTSGGAQSADQADWTPLARRRVRIWRDNDEAGKAYAGEVAHRLLALGCDLDAVDVDQLELPPKGDAADWVESHQNASSSDLDALPVVRTSATGVDASDVVLRGSDVVLRRGDDIVPEPVQWIWSGWLAAGKFHLIAGAPGTGKTTVALGLAATITSGGQWPDGTTTEPGDVLIWSGEDDPADTLAPRLIAMGADMSRVHFVQEICQDGSTRPFDPAKDVDALVRRAESLPSVRLMIIDPVVSAVQGDSHKNAETRRELQPLVTLARVLGCAVVGISHFTKGTAGRDPVERVTGSLAFAALARVVIVAAKMKADDEDTAGRPKRMLARAKSNIGPDDGGFIYDLELTELPDYPGVIASRVLWGGAMEGTARDLLANAETTDDPADRAAIDEAMDFLRAELEDGPMPAKDVQNGAKAAGHSEATLRRAKRRLGVRADKVAMRGGWSWSLPPKMLTESEDAQGVGVSTFGDADEHLPEARTEAAQAVQEDAHRKNVSTFGDDEHLRTPDEPRERF